MRADAQAARRKVCFLFIAQPHQVFHSLPIALALARGWPQIDVEVAATTQAQLDLIDDLTVRTEAAPLKQRLLGPGWLRGFRPNGASVPPKAAMLAANLGVLAGYDAIACPERTTTLIRRLGLKRPLLIYTQHGAGDRGGTFEPRLGLFDLVMASGPKTRDRIVEPGLARPENCVSVGYPKFDMVEALPPPRLPAFAQVRPVVLYNPHFDPALSSWPGEGLKVLEAFAADDRYNLIFAPHVRLFDAHHPDRAKLAWFADAPNIHIDLGGPAMMDMSYTRLADVYLGDVSSQVYEFLLEPRPCAFLNTHRVAWRGHEDYLCWTYGPVVEHAAHVIDSIDRSRADHTRLYRAPQEAGFAETFDLEGASSSQRAAQAIVRLLERAP
ncbi:glycerophosphotransferase [Phenylobacterium sp.]|uniref:glycerophosphotransferase n=1 Tax=Phenylobacterium sp. TaxID=1871053 RepID=UPI0039833F19